MNESEAMTKPRSSRIRDLERGGARVRGRFCVPAQRSRVGGTVSKANCRRNSTAACQRHGSLVPDIADRGLGVSASCWISLRASLSGAMVRRLSFLLDSIAMLNVVSCHQNRVCGIVVRFVFGTIRSGRCQRPDCLLNLYIPLLALLRY